MQSGEGLSRFRRAGEVVLIGAAYFLAAKLSLFLAIPPGYATPVWPPSGIALAGLLLFGARVWPGVLVGSFALNVWTSLDPTDPSSTLRSVVVALAIAAGSTFQALVGQRLVRGISGDPVSKPWEGRRVAALALGGPIACVTAATYHAGGTIQTRPRPWSDASARPAARASSKRP